MILLLYKSLKSDIFLKLIISEKLKKDEAELRRSDTSSKILVNVAALFPSCIIIYVVSTGHIQIERPFKNLGEKKKKTHNESSKSPTEIQAVFMAIKPVK